VLAPGTFSLNNANISWAYVVHSVPRKRDCTSHYSTGHDQMNTARLLM
jgi:hypothetical protein